MAVKVVGLSGSVARPSRTTALIRAILDAVTAQTGLTGTLIELADDAPHIFSALTRKHLTGRAAQVVQAVETADLLLVGTPVYRASYTGALKHLFDVADRAPFAGKPVILAATGGSKLHGLVLEHQLRPLFGFLNALTLPTTIYATEDDFSDFRLANPSIIERIHRAAAEAAVQLSLRRTLDAPQRAAAG